MPRFIHVDTLGRTHTCDTRYRDNPAHGDDLQAGLGVEEHPERRAHDCVIVGENDPNLVCLRRESGARCRAGRGLHHARPRLGTKSPGVIRDHTDLLAGNYGLDFGSSGQREAINRVWADRPSLPCSS